jgi:hypothetical protein
VAEFDETNETELDEDSPVVKELRKQLRAREKEAKEAAEARRELAFLKAGIPTDSPVGQLFTKAYDGDLGDIDALRSEWAKVGGTPSTEEAAPEAAPSSASTQAAERQALADGASASPQPEADPREESLQLARDLLDKKQLRWEQAAGELINRRANAAMRGDRRVVLVPNPDSKDGGLINAGELT